MALRHANLVKMATTTTGTGGFIDLSASIEGFRSIADAVSAGDFADGDTLHYSILDGNSREVCEGVYSQSLNRISRVTLASTNGEGPLDLSGEAVIALTALAQDMFTGPLSSTDNAIPRFNDTDGSEIENSGVTISDDNDVAGMRNLAITGYIDMPEISSPSNPDADHARFFFKDDGGTTKPYYRRSDGTEVEVGAGAGRTILLANGDIYVNGSTGNDSTGNGTMGAPYATIQKALNVAATLDFNGFTVTIHAGDGTYTAGGSIPRCTGQSGIANLVVQGNAVTPGNVVVSTTSAHCFTAVAPGAMALIKDMELRTTTSGYCLRATSGGDLQYSNIRFGTCAAAHVLAAQGGRVTCVGNYEIVGGAQIHIQADGAGAQTEVGSRTITLTGTPNFSVAFANATTNGVIRPFLNTYSGSATGVRHIANTGGGIQTFGGGVANLPGNAGGTTTAPGWDG